GARLDQERAKGRFFAGHAASVVQDREMGYIRGRLEAPLRHAMVPGLDPRWRPRGLDAAFRVPVEDAGLDRAVGRMGRYL
ncbi:MAG: hypothetical protein AVDCRST_MAG80-469, partial [uncultured Rubrobacteraceae bacterium]